ncbi:hypothetical protein C0989_003300 [Termitomyces sp. Mn162]|nr:hypothetical protein C0989_003300 [Termitomyces sp. Mn162]
MSASASEKGGSESLTSDIDAQGLEKLGYKQELSRADTLRSDHWWVYHLHTLSKPLTGHRSHRLSYSGRA